MQLNNCSYQNLSPQKHWGLFFGLCLIILGVLNTQEVHGQEKGLLSEKIEALPKLKKSEMLALTLFLGPIGGHRAFMGTKVAVPLVYTLTLGGGLGLLPLVDFFVILFSKDHSKYLDNPKVMMWLQDKKSGD